MVTAGFELEAYVTEIHQNKQLIVTDARLCKPFTSTIVLCIGVIYSCFIAVRISRQLVSTALEPGCKLEANGCESNFLIH